MITYSNPISITLTQALPESDIIEISKTKRQLYITAVGFTGTEVIRFQQFLSDHTGWTDIDISPTNLAPLTITSNTAGMIITFPFIAKIKIICTGIADPVEIKIDLSY